MSSAPATEPSTPSHRREDEFTTQRHVYEPHRVGLPPLRPYVRELWRRREFAFELFYTHTLGQEFAEFSDQEPRDYRDDLNNYDYRSRIREPFTPMMEEMVRLITLDPAAEPEPVLVRIKGDLVLRGSTRPLR